MKNLFLLPLALLLLSGCNGCSSAQENASNVEQSAHASIATRLPLRIDLGQIPTDRTSASIATVEIHVQVAVTEREQAKGLMFRKELADGDGMLFPYKKPQRMSFWMNNVPIGLDIGFFDSKGVLKEVRHMLPHDTRTVPSASGSIQYALEMADGWYARAGLKVGAQLDLTLLAEALRQRGEKPADYGLE